MALILGLRAAKLLIFGLKLDLMFSQTRAANLDTRPL
jgi:hypothetical protein